MMESIMPYIETANGTMWFADHRDATAHRPVTVMIHGAGGTHLDWPAELRRMPEANAILPDLPGHERSPGEGRTTVAGYASDIIALLDALKLERAIVAGHSMGGAIAQTLAVNHPDRLRGMILIGTGAKLGVHPDLLKALKAMTGEALDIIMDWYWGGDLGEIEQIRRLTRKRLAAISPRVIAGDYAAANNFDIRDHLHRIKTPTLIIGGTADKMTPFKYSEYLHEHIANSTLVKIEGGGHMMMLEQPKAVADAVQRWLSAL
ncbi:MAG: alpha/beta fold hydrolase [Chloroflexi bacterium]|nr:MAG: alpha/beta fold hydrolase [Chloroflexota bacterium]